MARCLDDRDYVHIWADGAHFNVRLAAERLRCLVIVGARLDGPKGARRGGRRLPGVH
jgi:hypothetical protein